MAALAALLISVKGKRDGELEITHYPTKLTCSFCVALTEERPKEALFVLYRLRVKESSILFSKTYGLLGHDKTGTAQPSTWDEITLYAQPAVMEMGKLSTIRVEYVAISEAEATGLITRGEVEKEYCRPFFTRGDTRHYEVKCTFREAPPRSPEKNGGRRSRSGRADGSPTSGAGAVIAATAALGIAAALVAAWRHGISFTSIAEAVRSWRTARSS